MQSSMLLMISPVSRARQIIANHLWTYGEDRLAGRAYELTDQEIDRLQEIAGYYAGTSDKPSGAGMLFAKAVALAAVEVMESEPRLLARSRRRPLDQSPYKKP